MLSETKRFLAHLQFEKRFSEHTLIAYETDLLQFAEFVRQTYKVEEIGAVNHLFVRSWIVSQIENGLNPRSINRRITTMRTFFRFLQREKIVSANPMLKIQAPKTAKRLPEFVDEQRMNLVLDKELNKLNYGSLRNHLILEFFYPTGVRLSELINLKITDVDLFGLQVKVLGKRNKVRHIPITINFRKQLDQYLVQREIFLKEKAVTSVFFFLNDKGNKMYPRFVYRIVKHELSNHQEITNSKKSPHILRHSFATALLNKGADINAIKELLGHSSLAATQVYTHNTIEKLKDIYKQAFPKA